MNQARITGNVRRVVIGVVLLGLIAAGAAGGLSIKGRMASAAASPYGQVIVPNLVLTAPLSPAQLTKEGALAVAKRKLEPSMFTHPFTVQYGSFDESGLALRLGGPDSTLQRLGVRDVWKITITGLRIVRPCGSFFRAGTAPKCPPPVSTLAVFVDDKLGQVLESEGY